MAKLKISNVPGLKIFFLTKKKTRKEKGNVAAFNYRK